MPVVGYKRNSWCSVDKGHDHCIPDFREERLIPDMAIGNVMNVPGPFRDNTSLPGGLRNSRNLFPFHL